MPVITTMADMAAEGCLVKPIFHQFIMDPAIPIDFTIRIQKPEQRKPDGWFHASKHPLASRRELWLYLARPEQHVPEVMGYPAKMSVMFGSLSHGVIERFLAYMGAAVPLPGGDCPACGRPYLPRGKRQVKDFRYCEEHGGCHLPTLSRCHLDSILDFGDGLAGFDFKSIYQFGFAKTKNLPEIRDMDAGHFRARWPHYYAQMQECMRLTGLSKYIVFFLTLGSPWDTREFHFDADPEFQAKTEEKYLEVIDCWRKGIEVYG